MNSSSAALASPSLAGASICTPTASSPTSKNPQNKLHHQRRRAKFHAKSEQKKGKSRTRDGGDLGSWLGMYSDCNSARWYGPETSRKLRHRRRSRAGVLRFPTLGRRHRTQCFVLFPVFYLLFMISDPGSNRTESDPQCIPI